MSLFGLRVYGSRSQVVMFGVGVSGQGSLCPARGHILQINSPVVSRLTIVFCPCNSLPRHAIATLHHATRRNPLFAAEDAWISCYTSTAAAENDVAGPHLSQRIQPKLHVQKRSQLPGNVEHYKVRFWMEGCSFLCKKREIRSAF